MKPISLLQSLMVCLIVKRREVEKREIDEKEYGR